MVAHIVLESALMVFGWKNLVHWDGEILYMTVIV